MRILFFLLINISASAQFHIFHGIAATQRVSVDSDAVLEDSAVPTGSTFLQSADYFVRLDASGTGDGSDSTIANALTWSQYKALEGTFVAGDTILFGHDDTYEGTIAVSDIGASGDPIVYGAWGSGQKPILSATDTITGWTQHSGNIYRAYTTLDIKQVFDDNIRVPAARLTNSGYSNITSTSGASITSTDIPSQASNYYTGCVNVARTGIWAMYTRSVTSSSATTITMSSEPSYGYDANEGFILFGHIDFLDEAGEWYYDATKDSLYVWLSDSSNPSSSNVVASYGTNDNVTIADGSDYIELRDLNIRYGIDGIDIGNCDYIEINNCDIIENSLNGILANNSSCTNITVDSCSIEGATEAGVWARGTNHTFTNNTVRDIGLFDEIDVDGVTGQRLLGIANYFGGSCTFEYNTLINIGSNGIHFISSPTTTVQYNYIDSVCSVLDDGGFIYCYDNETTNSDNSVIQYNIGLNSLGSNAGYNKTDLYGNGIYLDERVSYANVSNNTVYNCSYIGIYLHNNQYCDVDTNTVMDCLLGTETTYGSSATGNTHTGNIFLNTADAPTGGSNPILAYLHSDFNTVTTMDYNKYYDFHRTNPFRDLKDYTYYTFSGWQTLMNQDANSTFDGTALGVGEIEVLFYNASKASVAQDLSGYTWRDLSGATVSSLTLQPYTSKILIRE